MVPDDFLNFQQEKMMFKFDAKIVFNSAIGMALGSVFVLPILASLKGKFLA